eukprot:1419854-Karenia_brevis.AAC.1
MVVIPVAVILGNAAGSTFRRYLAHHVPCWSLAPIVGHAKDLGFQVGPISASLVWNKAVSIG